MRGRHRTVCGRCLDDFDDIWALKHHQDDCLRRESPGGRYFPSGPARALRGGLVCVAVEGEEALRVCHDAQPSSSHARAAFRARSINSPVWRKSPGPTVSGQSGGSTATSTTSA